MKLSQFRPSAEPLPMHATPQLELTSSNDHSNSNSPKPESTSEQKTTEMNRMATMTLFAPSIIPQEASSSFPDGFTLRPLSETDYTKGFLDCLRVLTHVGDLTEADFHERYEEMAESKGTYYVLVIEHEGRIVGTGTLVVEKKFIHNRGKCGHVEEIAIDKAHQGKGLGLKMIKALDAMGVAVGCYKSILNCGSRNEPFYVKCGYHNSGIEMSHYFEEEKDSYHRG